jgi:hypothetical protein
MNKITYPLEPDRQDERVGDLVGAGESDLDVKTVYGQLCDSYRAIDTFRTTLLSLLPLASGVGIFLLFQKEPITLEQKSFLLPIGAFGFVITLGLFLFEIYGIKKCGALITAGRKLEQLAGIRGQFFCRPRAVARVIDEPFASGVIYPAVLAAWAFLASRFVWPTVAPWIALAVFSSGFLGMLAYNIILGRGERHRPECEEG